MAGFLLAVVTYFPLFQGLTHFANPALEKALAESPVTVVADPAGCSFQLKLTGTESYTTPCDVAKSTLVTRSVNYTNEAAPAGSPVIVKVGNDDIHCRHAGLREEPQRRDHEARLSGIGQPDQINYPMTVLLLFILVVYVTMVYGPIAAWLVELFPTRIRYTGMSLPYHIGNGWFGGFLPATVFAIVAATGNIYSGLWYPIIDRGDELRRGADLPARNQGRDINNIYARSDRRRRRETAGPSAATATPRPAGRFLFDPDARARSKITLPMPDFMSKALGPPWHHTQRPEGAGLRGCAHVDALATSVVGLAVLALPRRAHRRRLSDPGADLGDPLGLVARRACRLRQRRLDQRLCSPGPRSRYSCRSTGSRSSGLASSPPWRSSRAGLPRPSSSTPKRRSARPAKRAGAPRPSSLREALIGSVSHELRTPLASILGAATVLASARRSPADRSSKRWPTSCATRAERLNNEIQNLLDATRISSDGPAAALRMGRGRRHRQCGAGAAPRAPRRPRRSRSSFDPNLPLVYVDPVLVRAGVRGRSSTTPRSIRRPARRSASARRRATATTSMLAVERSAAPG